MDETDRNAVLEIELPKFRFQVQSFDFLRECGSVDPKTSDAETVGNIPLAKQCMLTICIPKTVELNSCTEILMRDIILRSGVRNELRTRNHAPGFVYFWNNEGSNPRRQVN